jgi:DNA repair protein RadD
MQAAVDFERPPVKYQPRDYQEAAIKAGLDFFRRKSGPNEIQVLPTGCHAKGAKILMHDLSVKAVEDVVVGDKLKCPTTGGAKEVLQLCRGKGMMYRIRYGVSGVGGDFHDVNGGHILHLSESPVLVSGCDVIHHVSVNEFLERDESWRHRQTLEKWHDWASIMYPFTIEPLEEDDFYGFTLDGDHLYMTSDRIIHHNSGKSLIIAGIAEGLQEPVLILQPSKEILQQNYEKFISYGGHAGIFSASVGRKDLGMVTFASLASIMAKDRTGAQRSMQHFLHYKNIIIDECHLQSNSAEGMLKDFLSELGHPRVVGLTATPFRLYPHTDRDGGTRDSMLKFLTRTSPRIFGKVGYHIQIAELKERGYLANCRYFDVRSELSHGFDRNAIKVNSTGADYDEDALQKYYDTIDFKTDIVKLIRRINAAGKQVLCFMSSVADAEFVSRELGNSATVTGKTSKAEREAAERDFKNGKLRSVCNCGVWTTGFDYPALKVVLIARPLRSLAMYYQMFGRAIRPYNDTDAWMVDACGNLGVFGRIEDLRVEFDSKNGLPMITGSSGRILTGVPLKEQEFFQGETLK